MHKMVWFFLLICLHFSHGADPQPEQIHLSSTGKERKAVKLKKNVVNQLSQIMHICCAYSIQNGEKIHDNHRFW